MEIRLSKDGVCLESWKNEVERLGSPPLAASWWRVFCSRLPRGRMKGATVSWDDLWDGLMGNPSTDGVMVQIVCVEDERMSRRTARRVSVCGCVF